MKTTQELISLLSLIDDGDTAVRTAVEEKLIEMGEDVFDEMEKLYPELEYKFCPEFYFTYLSNLRLNYTLKKLKLYLSNPDPLLMDGLLLVTSALDPKLDKYYYMNIVQDMSDEIVEELSDSKTAIENLEIFNYIFFHRMGFKHADESVIQEEKALMPTVLETKRGNIFTVPICYFLLSRYAGLPIYPLIINKSFTPAYIDNDNNILFYINIYKDGLIFNDDYLQKKIEAISENTEKPFARLGLDRALVSIYADHLLYLYKQLKNAEKENVMKKILECFGSERYIN